jgi:hypothetical protein
MRLHTMITDEHAIRDAIRAAGARPIELSRHRSRLGDVGWEVKLAGCSPYRTQSDPDEYAASWDQWGVFLAALYDHDPDMVVGSGWKYAVYRDACAFHYATGHRFEDGRPEVIHHAHRFRPARPYEAVCSVTVGPDGRRARGGELCGAVTRWDHRI